MRLRKRIKKLKKLSGKPDMPFEISRFFPDIYVSDCGIEFALDGDMASLEEARSTLKYLLKELSKKKKASNVEKLT